MRAAALLSMIALLMLVPITQHAVGADSKGGIGVWGAGSVSCGSWLELRRVPREQLPAGDHRREGREQWLLGFITASNIYTPDRADLLVGTDAQGAYAWVDQWCRSHPLKSIENAARALVIKLSERH